MGIRVISANDLNAWNAAVRSFREHDVYYLAEYVKAFEAHGDGVPLLFYYEDGHTRAMNVSMKRDISADKRFVTKLPANTYYDLSTPYGYGGFIVEGDNIGGLDVAYSTYCKENGIISEFVRFHPLLNNQLNVSQIYGIQDVGPTVHMDLESGTQIWACITSKNRNTVRRAQKLGVRIHWGQTPELMEQFRIMYHDTMIRREAHEYYDFNRTFFGSLVTDLKYNCLVFYALYANIPVAMAVILCCNHRLHYHLAASTADSLSCGAANLLLFEAAQWGYNNGYRSFHLGGGVGAKKDGLYNFKKAFNSGDSNDFAIGKKCFDRVNYDRLVCLRRNEPGFHDKSLFYPLYRA